MSRRPIRECVRAFAAPTACGVFTQVKELGYYVSRSTVLAAEVDKIFQVYWILGGAQRIPPSWPPELETDYNVASPLLAQLNGAR